MKKLIILTSLAIVTIIIFQRCYSCYPCVKKGESFNLPYSNDQPLSFVNDSQEVKSFNVFTFFNLPPEEYCGPIGSSSYGDCSGSARAALRDNESLNSSIVINYNTDFSDGTELTVKKRITVYDSHISINGNSASTYDNGGIVKKSASINLSGKLYNNIIEYSRDSSLVSDNNCIYFVYSETAGLLKYSIKQSHTIVNWTIKL